MKRFAVILLALFCLASGVATGLLTYLPLFLVQARGSSPAASNVMTSVLLAAAAALTTPALARTLVGVSTS